MRLLIDRCHANLSQAEKKEGSVASSGCKGLGLS